MSIKLLPPDEVHVWYRLTAAISPDELRALEQLLSPAERERSRRFVFDRDRRDFTAAHALLRQALSLYGGRPPLEWRFVSNAYGKPSIVSDQPTTLVYNLSHTRGLVACALAASTDVGVDVEGFPESPTTKDIAAQFFSVIESRQLDACAPEQRGQRFTELWTLKEAFIKAIGTGLNHPLDSFSFTFDQDGRLQFDTSDNTGAQWQFALAAPAPDYRLAVAVRCEVPARPYRITVESDRDGASTATQVVLPCA